MIAVAVIPAALRALVCVAVTVLALAAHGSLGARLGDGNQGRATVGVVG